MVAQKKGAKLTDNPKDYMLRVRMDKTTVSKMEHCCKKLNVTKSELVRMGIQEVFAKTK